MTSTTPSESVLSSRNGLREVEIELVAKLGAPPANITESYTTIPTPDGHTLRAKLWTPTSVPNKDCPLIVLFHGGGFGAGSYEMCTVPGRDFAQAFGAVVIAPAYRLAPEHKFPRSVMDGVETVRWLSANAESNNLGNPAKGFIIGGFSAGGNIAAVAAHQASDIPNPITGSFLSIAHLVTKQTVPSRYAEMFKSREENEHHNGSLNTWEREFIPNDLAADIRSPLFSPINAPLSELAALPRTFIQTGAWDVLRDDGAIYAKILEEAGVECRLYCQAGQDHQAQTIWYDESKGSPKELKIETMKGVAWLLRREWVGE